jgi:hypothetical protein
MPIAIVLNGFCHSCYGVTMTSIDDGHLLGKKLSRQSTEASHMGRVLQIPLQQLRRSIRWLTEGANVADQSVN